MKMRVVTILAALASSAAIAAVWLVPAASAYSYCDSGNNNPCVWRDPGYAGDNSPNLIMVGSGNFSAYQPGPGTIDLQGWAYLDGSWHSDGTWPISGKETHYLYPSLAANVTVHAEDMNDIGASNVTLYFPY